MCVRERLRKSAGVIVCARSTAGASLRRHSLGEVYSLVKSVASWDIKATLHNVEALPYIYALPSHQTLISPYVLTQIVKELSLWC